MTFDIAKHERETNQSLIRRFTKRLRESGILVGVKKSTFHHRQKSKQMQRRVTLRKLDKQKEYQRLLKLGQVEKDKRGRRK